VDRAGATNREMLGALGVDVRLLFALVFALGTGLAALAGGMAGPLYGVRLGMGEDVLILTFVVIVVGGIGSVRGALAGALVVGLVDTLGRAFLPGLLGTVLERSEADALGASLATVAIYVLMAAILAVRPRGLFPPGPRTSAWPSASSRSLRLRPPGRAHGARTRPLIDHGDLPHKLRRLDPDVRLVPVETAQASRPRSGPRSSCTAPCQATSWPPPAPARCRSSYRVTATAPSAPSRASEPPAPTSRSGWSGSTATATATRRRPSPAISSTPWA
jgi:hypothetical protein